MQLNLKKPIVFFDLETTGVDILHDRIVEISLIKVLPGGRKSKRPAVSTPRCTFPRRLRLSII